MLFMVPAPSRAQWTTPQEVFICTDRNRDGDCIAWLDGDATEPTIAYHGKFLCWQDELGGSPTVKLHCAKRKGDDANFDHLGSMKKGKTVMKGVVTPGFDPEGQRLYWFDIDRLAIRSGLFDGNRDRKLSGVRDEDMPFPAGEFWIGPELYYETGRVLNMVFTRRVFGDSSQMNIGRAQKLGGVWQDVTGTEFANVNTADLEYAPAVSCQGRQLTFTRLELPIVPGILPTMYISTRPDTQSAWGVPTPFDEQWGFNEAMSMRCHDERAYFHAYDVAPGDDARIYTTRRDVW
jgi:hypothetical protein